MSKSNTVIKSHVSFHKSGDVNRDVTTNSGFTYHLHTGERKCNDVNYGMKTEIIDAPDGRRYRRDNEGNYRNEVTGRLMKEEQ